MGVNNTTQAPGATTASMFLCVRIFANKQRKKKKKKETTKSTNINKGASHGGGHWWTTYESWIIKNWLLLAYIGGGVLILVLLLIVGLCWKKKINEKRELVRRLTVQPVKATRAVITSTTTSQATEVKKESKQASDVVQAVELGDTLGTSPQIQIQNDKQPVPLLSDQQIVATDVEKETSISPRGDIYKYIYVYMFKKKKKKK
ncbi:hypothetical protein RFI_19412, partial [Reticulomyxa filosa]